MFTRWPLFTVGRYTRLSFLWFLSEYRLCAVHGHLKYLKLIELAQPLEHRINCKSTTVLYNWWFYIHLSSIFQRDVAISLSQHHNICDHMSNVYSLVSRFYWRLIKYNNCLLVHNKWLNVVCIAYVSSK